MPMRIVFIAAGNGAAASPQFIVGQGELPASAVLPNPVWRVSPMLSSLTPSLVDFVNPALASVLVVEFSGE